MTKLPKKLSFSPYVPLNPTAWNALWAAVSKRFLNMNQERITYIGNDGKDVYLVIDNRTPKAEVITLPISKI